MCVREVDDPSVLQFTRGNASGRALHRHTSRVIHRSELVYTFKVLSARRAAPAREESPPVPHRHGRSTLPCRTGTGGVPSPQGKAGPTESGGNATVVGYNTVVGAVIPHSLNPASACMHARGRGTPQLSSLRAAAVPAPCWALPSLSQLSLLSLPSMMILPQVHLRKPCYDFYFL